MPTITIPKETSRGIPRVTRRDLKAWGAIRGIWRAKKIPDPVEWQRQIRREWERVLP